MDSREVIRAIAAPTGDIGASFYFVPETLARGKELGLDGFRFYVLGRGGVLGDVEPAVVRSAFGYFHPSLVERMWTSAKEIVTPRAAAREYIACAHEHGRRRFDDVTGLDAYVDAATAVIAHVEGVSMPLFAGVRAEPVPADAAAAAMHQAMVLREMRGSMHLLALTAAGLPSHVAHAIKRPDDVGVFGWKDDPPVPTDADREAWARAEALTDDLLAPAFAALTDVQTDALLAGTTAMHAALPAG
jgi:hypothetical protein